jgi:hypothetical protein
LAALALLVIAIIWIAVLLPPILRSRAERRSASSIVEFRRSLGVLNRNVVPIVEPANRLRPPSAPTGQGPGAGAVARFPRPALRVAPLVHGPAGRPVVAPGQRRRPSPAARRRTVQRRRDVLCVLVSTTVGSALVGALPRLHLLWAATGLAAVSTAAYLAALVQLRRRAEERRVKLAYLPRRVVAPEPPPAWLRRSAN